MRTISDDEFGGGVVVTAVGIVGENSDRARELLSDPDRSLTVGSADRLRDAELDLLVACGEAAVLDLVDGRVETPVLPADAPSGLPSIRHDELSDAVDAVVAGDAVRRERPLFDVSIGDERVARALLDATLVTDEPAKISEYGIFRDGEPVESVRADGIVVTTPAGSDGYASAAGGPLLAPDSGVLSVVPISPFRTDPDRWVLPNDAVALSVERDDAPVSLFVDGQQVGSPTVERRVELTPDGSFPVIVPGNVSAPIPDRPGESQKH